MQVRDNSTESGFQFFANFDALRKGLEYSYGYCLNFRLSVPILLDRREESIQMSEVTHILNFENLRRKFERMLLCQKFSDSVEWYHLASGQYAAGKVQDFKHLRKTPDYFWGARHARCVDGTVKDINRYPREI